jgi:hypothetical protein
MGIFSVLVILVQMFCLYSYLYDKRLTMALAAPLAPQGTKFIYESHNEPKDRKMKRFCQGVWR